MGNGEINDPKFTHEQVSKVLSYDPESGLFTRISGQHAGVKVGCVVARGYVKIRVLGCPVPAHRLAWLLSYKVWPDGMIDHVDGKRNNNALQNLRLATHSQNSINARLNSRNTTGFKGVTARRGKFIANIYFNRKQIFLGRFDHATDAAAAYEAAAKRLFGEFARVA